jgi:hypothetical protein
VEVNGRKYLSEGAREGTVDFLYELRMELIMQLNRLLCKERGPATFSLVAIA